jgi:hypothetical protein
VFGNVTLTLRINYRTDCVGAFDPQKVVGLVKRAFADTIIDPLDYQEMRLKRELDFFSQVPDPERRERMVRRAWRDAWDNGPTLRFEIPRDGGEPIKGMARRYRISFELPEGLDEATRNRLEGLLKGLAMGHPVYEEEANLPNTEP